MTEEDAIINGVLELARERNFEEEHTCQVTNLSLQLFDQLVAFHGLADKERVLLKAAALLHDIGRTNGGKKHHKIAQDIILHSEKLPFEGEDKIIVALIARYHRKSLPDDGHHLFSDLSGKKKKIVRKLAALLRVADGLDRSHQSVVTAITCDVLKDSVVFDVRAKINSEVDRMGSLDKADLFEREFKKSIIIKWTLPD